MIEAASQTLDFVLAILITMVVLMFVFRGDLPAMEMIFFKLSKLHT